jgi:hypothetical protein
VSTHLISSSCCHCQACRTGTGETGSQHGISSEPKLPLDGAALQDKIIVRIEVTDTGPGIRTTDLAQNELFCASYLLPRLLRVTWLQPPSIKQSKAGRKVLSLIEY